MSITPLYKPNKPGMYLHLYHGRNFVEQDMEDWGFDGPYFGPLEAVVTTYAETIRIFDKQANELWLSTKGSCIEYDDKFFGDWTVYQHEVGNKA